MGETISEKYSRKKKISMFVIVTLFLLYFIGTDPDSQLITDLPFGADLISVFSIFIIATTGIAFVSIVPDIFTDRHFNEERLIDVAKTTPEGAGAVLRYKALQVLAYSLIVSVSILGYVIS